MKKYPNKIYLQIEDCCGNVTAPKDLENEDNVTWSTTRINKSDLVYYRKAVKDGQSN